ncbi:MAG: protein kinase [Deltaproteobacteria bacterium]|nr:protein kinase [Deltaproteobacteria bacterium]
MTLAAGRRLGPYDIEAVVGEGGMGEVYRARDSRLNRVVAIKVLPRRFAENVERRERFWREAQAVASLNHPNICTLYDVGDADGVAYLVMEFVDGTTLSDELKKQRPLSRRRTASAFDAISGDHSKHDVHSLKRLLQIGKEVASALEVAHRAGVVHRDLKPGNIMLTKTGTKLLDFGLAKIIADTSQATADQMPAVGNADSFPTKASETAPNRILGTLRYCAPEQLEGRPVDARTDIFALGLVLYELAAGKPAFDGDSDAALIAAILEHEPVPISSMHPLFPENVERVIMDCLAKTPDERWQSAGDLRRQLENLSPTPRIKAKTPRMGWQTVALIVAGVATTIGAYALGMRRPGNHPPPPPTVVSQPLRFALELPGLADPESFALSPDGKQLAYLQRQDNNVPRVMVRPMDGMQFVPVAGSEGATGFFWSPDARRFALISHTRLRLLELATGRSISVGEANGRFDGGSWSPRGQLIFSIDGKLFLADESGLLNAWKLSPAFRTAPRFIPGTDYVTYVRPDKRDIFIAKLGSLEERRVMDGGGVLAVDPEGSLLFTIDETLLAQAFDFTKMAPVGAPYAVAQQLPDMNRRMGISVASGGLLAYAPHFARLSQATLVSAAGKVLRSWDLRAEVLSFDVGQKSKRLLFSTPGEHGWRELRLFDGENSEKVMASNPLGPIDDPMWAPDEQAFAYVAQLMPGQVMSRNVKDGSVRTLFSEPSMVAFLEDWSHDGTLVIILRPLVADKQMQIILLNHASGAVLGRYFDSFRDIDEAALSPDGRWLVYGRSNNGMWNIVARPTGKAGESQASIVELVRTESFQPKWTADGKGIYYLTADSTLMMMALPGGEPVAGLSGVPLFATGIEFPSPYTEQYRPLPDGTFMLLRPSTTKGFRGVHILSPWKTNQPAR